MVPGSVAEATGIQVGDVVVDAAGASVVTRADLVFTIRRQAPGTWLPITVRRDGADRLLIAKFPAD